VRAHRWPATSTSPAGPFTCYDYWQGGAIGAIQEDAPVGNRVRIKGVFALPGR
jgi:hypothetical protein